MFYEYLKGTVLSQLSSVLLDRSIDTADEHIGGVEPNGPSEKPEPNDHDESVAKIQQGGNEIHNVELEERE